MLPKIIVFTEGDTTEVQECWCVFDVEAPKPYARPHAHLKEAWSLAKQHGIKLAITNPCFELCLVLHHRYQSAWLSNEDAEHTSRQLDGHIGKHIQASTYMPIRSQAIINAEQLAKWHEGNGTDFPNDNPSSGMSALLRAVGAQ